MRVQKGAVVKLHYVLTVDGELVEDSSKEEPLSYIHGASEIIPGLEEALEGMEVGEKKSVTVSPDKGYGERDPKAQKTVSKSAFRDAEQLRVGVIVSGESAGQRVRAMVESIDGDQVVLNFNHPMAGKTLHFAIQVIEVNKE